MTSVVVGGFLGLGGSYALFSDGATLQGQVTAGTWETPPPPTPPECASLEPFDHVIVGTEGPDELTGTSGRDLIFGLGGNDKLKGVGQADCLVGGPGNDKLFSGNSGGKLLGGPGEDRLYGGNGSDYLDGGPDNDKLYGGNGADHLIGGPGAHDYCDGGSGPDTIDPSCEHACAPHHAWASGHHSVPTIVISWQPAEEAKLYNVYRAEKAGGPYTRVGTANGTSYSDVGVKEDTAYYYIVTAEIIEGLETEPSNEAAASVASVTATPTPGATQKPSGTVVPTATPKPPESTTRTATPKPAGTPAASSSATPVPATSATAAASATTAAPTSTPAPTKTAAPQPTQTPQPSATP